jgi:hypothetical protein
MTEPRVMQRSRVTIDFPLPERDVLQQLCEQDIRPAAEQIRWLVLTEAQRRGILSNENSDSAPTSHRQDTVAAP